MATRAIRPKRDEGLLSGNWEALQERAPSVIRVDRPLVARILAFAGLTLAAVGGLAMIFAAAGRPYLIGPNPGFVLFSLGLCFLLFHAFRDAEIQYRRVYGIAGFLLLAVGGVLRLYPWQGTPGGLFLIYGIPCLLVGLLFLTAVIRNETDVFWRTYVLRLLGALGALMILAGLIGGNVSQSFLEVEGALLLVLGVFFVGAYIGLQDSSSQEGYRAALALGGVGAVGFVVALLRSWLGEDFLVPSGFVLMSACLVYFLVALGTCSDIPVVVLTRRELAALFYSPIAYFVLFGMLIVGWIQFSNFLDLLSLLSGRGGLEEPFLRNYFINFFTVICTIFVVPVLTMRLLSEEKKSGTLEVLLTAPVNESSIVISKFLAVLVFYLLSFLPWFLFLFTLRVISGEPFEYRPLLSFVITLIFTGASVLSAGLFFSSLTRNQIVSAVVGFVFMAFYTYTSQFFLQRLSEPWSSIIGYVSYLDLWLNSLEGQFAPRFLLFHLSLAFFFLFVTTKVLEARKWT
jgi:ABC-type transport system involved in multi-copper enzyme maturation permease subunit